MNSSTFEYKHIACPIDYNGCCFDSLLELKYALTIEAENAYLREGLEIYFNPNTIESTLNIQYGIVKYIPDFLTRNWYNGKAQLIEIKPEGFDNYEYLDVRQKICNHFINEYGYDWEYKVVYEDEIVMTEKQTETFQAILSNKKLYKKLHGYPSYDQRPFHEDGRRCFRSVPHRKKMLLTDMQYRLLVRRGILPLT